eukprot:16450216-Heterocapsa_arctica.AAC.1
MLSPPGSEICRPPECNRGKSKPGDLTWFRAIVTTRTTAPCATKRPLGRPICGRLPRSRVWDLGELSRGSPAQ